MKYVDGYLIPVSNDKKDDYFELARVAAPIFKENGAIGISECWGDDVPDGEVTSFPWIPLLRPKQQLCGP